MLRGVPQNCVIEATEDQPISELLKKGERIADAVERYRHRLREGAADLHRLRSRAWPSALQMEKAEAQVQQWAEAGAPDLDSMIEHNAPLTFPMVSLSSFVRGTASTRFRRDHKFSWGSMLAGPRPDAGEDQGRSE